MPERRTVYLTGMPGAGKTTIGRAVAGQLGLTFLDLDAEIERAAGCTIPQLFERVGEAGFRDLETQALAQASADIIATGGGILTRAENCALLHRGWVAFIDRPLEAIQADIDTKNRPLLRGAKERLRMLYDARIETYRTHADAVIPNTGNLADVASATAQWILQL